MGLSQTSHRISASRTLQGQGISEEIEYVLPKAKVCSTQQSTNLLVFKKVCRRMQVQVTFLPNTAVTLDHKPIYICRSSIWNYSISNSIIWFGLVYKADRHLNNLSGTTVQQSRCIWSHGMIPAAHFRYVYLKYQK